MNSKLALLTVSALLLASCGRTPAPAPKDPATVPPSPPVVGKSVELQNVAATTSAAAQQLTALFDVNNPNLDPSLKTLLGLFSSGSFTGQALNLNRVGSLGQQLAQSFGGQGRMVTLASTSKIYLPTGTYTFTTDGKTTYDAAPTDGYVRIDQKKNTRLAVSWKVSGAPTVWVNDGNAQREVPTVATASLTEAGQVTAALNFNMTPGDCLNNAGPTALNLNGYVGSAANPAAKLDLKYAWTEQNLSLNASALFATASADMNLNVTGTTRDRCDDAFAFTPTRTDLTGKLQLPGFQAELAVYLRELSNLEISAKALNAPNPYDRIGGTVNASLKLKGSPFMTATGPLADGNDANMQPGDQVKVQYIKNGALMTTDLAGAAQDLGAMFNPKP